MSPAVGYEVPYGPEEEPCDGVGHDEDEQRAAPVEVHQRGEDVGQVPVRLPHVAVLHVTAAVLLHVALPLTPSSGCGQMEVRVINMGAPDPGLVISSPKTG